MDGPAGKSRATYHADRRSSTAAAPLGVADESQHATANRVAPYRRTTAAESIPLLCPARHGGAIMIDKGHEIFRKVGEKLKFSGIQWLA
jgi:hypothetical protein